VQSHKTQRQQHPQGVVSNFTSLKLVLEQDARRTQAQNSRSYFCVKYDT